MLGLIQITAFIGPLTIVPGIIFWTKITVHESKTFWMPLWKENGKTETTETLGQGLGTHEDCSEKNTRRDFRLES